MGSFSIWHWLIVLVIVVLVFGTKKLPTISSDLAKAVKSFKDGLKTDEDKVATNDNKSAHDKTIDVDVKEKTKF